jgi:hypothetical protein
MARGKVDKREARRSANEDRRQDQRMSQRMSKMEREIGEMRRTAPPRPEDVVAREVRPGEGRGDYLKIRPGNADYSEVLRRDMDRLHGQSTSGTMSDHMRGAGSPLGRGRRK